MKTHAEKAGKFLTDEKRADWHDQTLWIVRKKRDKAVSNVPEWEELRERASKIKEHVLSNIDTYLLQFEAEAVKNGAQVHWAFDAESFNKKVYSIISSHKAQKVVKSKSMLTEECGMNPYLESKGIEVVDTDLGERIIQFRNEPPSHIVLPAIHLKKEEIGELFHIKLGTTKGASDAHYLTGAAREHLRKKFLSAEVAISGVNFAIAETGTVVVCTNEGNADMGIQSAPVQIHCMGIEKILPGASNLGIFTRMLARNATGQPVSAYTSHYQKPKDGGEMHIIIVDNGRSKHLGSNIYRNSLKCIRCGACLNTCPVYRRSGGHSYSYVIPGPIGSILSPLYGLNKYKDLPFASSLCGSCTNICPVKIDIHQQLYHWRQEISENRMLSLSKRYGYKLAGKILADSRYYNFFGKRMRWAINHLPRKVIYNRINVWGKGRELPSAPEKTFKQWYKENQIKNKIH
jgi:L-lactate dehydrogenase complex protein LldF